MVVLEMVLEEVVIVEVEAMIEVVLNEDLANGVEVVLVGV